MAATGHTVAAMSGLRVAVTAKQFGTAPVLADIAFELAAGERAALIGPSGIGKTTLLSSIAVLDSAFGGQITRLPGALAMVFQTPRLLPWRTLAQNITLAHPACTPGRARALLDAVGLAAAADLHPEKASLGMQRRAAMARALAVAPSLILMDQPLVSLDAASSARVQAVMVDVLDRSGATCFIATHDHGQALAVAGRLLELGGSPARLVSDRRSPLSRQARGDPRARADLQARWFPAPS